MKLRAIRNIDRCTKDCLCLYVCPTGATDTETGQIDASKCIACGACAVACPSHAIVLVPYLYPDQQPHTEKTIAALKNIVKSKSEQEQIINMLITQSVTPVEKQLNIALAKSNRIMGEDILRESGYMLPQSNETKEFLESLKNNPDPAFPTASLERLIELLYK
ncbi:MAG: 4Fe-4S binding protein [Bacilli bacterium]